MGDDPYENLEKDIDAIKAWLDKYRVEPAVEKKHNLRLHDPLFDSMLPFVWLLVEIIILVVLFSGILDRILR
jgi:hypothetical protein